MHATRRPSALIENAKALPAGVTETVVPVCRSRQKTSLLLFASFGIRLLAWLTKATCRPPESIAGAEEAALPPVPFVLTLTN